MQRILLTGATGFIGQHCLETLRGRPYEVHATYRDTPLRAAYPDIHWHPVDLLEADQTTNLIREIQPSHLLHLAWYVEHGEYWTSPENLRWVQASLHLIREFVEYGGEQIVIGGTCAEYDWRYGLCSTTSTPLQPLTLYGAAKHALHTILQPYTQQTNVRLAWGRIFFTFGPYEQSGRLVAALIRTLLQQTDPFVCTSGDHVRDFLYVKDVAAAFITLLESDAIGAFNIASGTALRIRDLIQIISDQTGGAELIQYEASTSSPGNPHILVADTSRLRDEVGWKPRLTLEQSIEETIEWWHNQLRNGEQVS